MKTRLKPIDRLALIILSWVKHNQYGPGNIFCGILSRIGRGKRRQTCLELDLILLIVVEL